MPRYEEQKLSREQRLKIYQEALRTFEIMAAKSQHKEHVTGMCDHIHNAAHRWFNRGRHIYSLSVCRKNFPSISRTSRVLAGKRTPRTGGQRKHPVVGNAD
jgi:hypothetical protein